MSGGNVMDRLLSAAAGAAIEPAERTCESGAFLFRQGFPTDGIRFIRSGLCKSSVLAANGAEVLVGLHGPGECLGDVEYFLEGTALCSVAALERTVVLDLSADKLRRLRRTVPELDFALGRNLSLRLAENARRFAINYGYPLEYNLLVAAVSRLGAEDRPVRKAELLEYLGVSSRHLNRVLAGLASRGLVAVRDGAVVVTDEVAVRRVLARTENE